MNAIEFRNIAKRFGECHSNRNLSFKVESGSIHGLVGENGAGKSTAMKILFGIHQPDDGEILIQGEISRIKNSMQALKLGIGMVHQHFMLAPSETVLDNIILGQERTLRGFFLDRKKALNELSTVAHLYGLSFDKWRRLVGELSVGEQQRVEILKLLYQKSEVLILDEPTAVLTPQEVKELFENLKRLKREGKTIILISHKLKEVLEFADSVTVMRRGESVGTKKITEVDEDLLAQMMVGRPVSLRFQGERKMPANQAALAPSVHVENLTIESRTEPIRNLNFELKPNEILGIAGVQGNGQTELLRFLSHPAMFPKVKGNYTIKGRSMLGADPLDLRAQKVCLIPEDRLSEGLLLRQDMVDNFLLGQYHDSRYSASGFIRRGELEQSLDSKIKEFDIRPTDSRTLASQMSGGNQQKLVIARALDPSPEILYVAHPTRGVDVGAIEKIHEAIVAERNKGRAVLLFSSELEELMDLSDRILVFFGGEIKGEFLRRDFDLWTLGKIMGGGEKRGEVKSEI